MDKRFLIIPTAHFLFHELFVVVLESQRAQGLELFSWAFSLFPSTKTGLYSNYKIILMFKGINGYESASKGLMNYISGRKILWLFLTKLIMKMM